MEESLAKFWQGRINWQRQVLLIVGLSIWSVFSLIVAVQIERLLLSVLDALSILDGLSANTLAVLEGVILYFVMFVVLVGTPWLALRWRSSLKLLGFDRLPQWIDIGMALAGLVFYFLIAGIVMWLISEYLPQVDVNQAQNTGISTPYGFDRTMVFFLFVVIGPIMEELIFRGYMYGVLRKNGVSFVLATIVVSILFGAAHGQWNVAINVGILSVMMCIGREVTGSIWPGILIHMMKNGIAFYLLFVSGIPGLT